MNLARFGKSDVWSFDRANIVVKYLPMDRSCIERAVNELTAARMRLDGIAPKCYGWCYTSDHPADRDGEWVSICYERYPETLREHGKLDRAETDELFRVLRAMHARGAFHGDIHAENVVLRRVGGRALPEIRFIDFELASYPRDEAERRYRQSLDFEAFEASAMRRFISPSTKRKREKTPS